MVDDDEPSDDAAVARIFRDEYRRVVGSLARMLGDLGAAEDAVQDAFAVACRSWRTDGVPASPAGWIVTTARNRAIDRLRREARGRALQRQIVDDADLPPTTEQTWRDDQLRLVFMCCHPALGRGHQVALTLRLVGGLEIADIARAFLVTETAMAKRLVRAKHKIKAANIPYVVPEAGALPGRVASVLAVIYLVYNAGADDPGRVELRRAAIRLARTIVELMPDEPEALGLLALVLLVESRMPARFAAGQLVLLRDQDRARWDRGLIAEGHDIVRRCLRLERPGPYQLQAAVHAVHGAAESFEQTDWDQIVAIYDHLLELAPTAVIALNRAIAVSETTAGPAVALALVDALADELATYHFLHATRGELLVRLGEPIGASLAFGRAAELAPSDADRSHLAARLATIGRPARPT